MRFWGTVPNTAHHVEKPNTAHHVEKIAAKLAERHGRIAFTYEAGPCGYEIHRLLRGRGFDCDVIARWRG